MIKESDILEIVKEDILRILGERKKKVSLETITNEINVFSSFVSRVINELEKEELIQSQQAFFKLTEKGKEKAKSVLRKHLVLENYFKERRSKKEAHEIAHILEHYISEEIIRNIKKLSTFKGIGIPLTELELHKESLITDITIPDDKLFERIVSMGIFPGEKIRMVNVISGRVIVRIQNKKFALDKNIAKEIKVLEHEES
jgi:Mn-dependent DtxR family transcriptional regulator